MKRKEFIKYAAVGSSVLGLNATGLNLPNAASKKRITILHTNDVHSHIEPFASNDKRNANKGGVARRATLIEQIRTDNPDTLLLDAGDMFQGTPYFNYYGGELEFKLMSMLKYDAATIGNHDFDNSIDGLYAQLPHAKFDLLSANYDFKNTVLDTHVRPYKTFVRNGIKIGVFGLGIELEGLVDKKMYKETKYLDPIEMTTDVVSTLKQEEHCDLVICLSHLGYDYDYKQKISDINLAKATKDIDLIIGGHTHTFLKEAQTFTNKNGQPVLVNQVGAYGLYLGRVDFYFDDINQKSSTTTALSIS